MVTVCFNPASSLVFGVPLVDLVTQEGNDVPKIVRRVVEHVEEEGMQQPWQRIVKVIGLKS